LPSSSALVTDITESQIPGLSRSPLPPGELLARQNLAGLHLAQSCS